MIPNRLRNLLSNSFQMLNIDSVLSVVNVSKRTNFINVCQIDNIDVSQKLKTRNRNDNISINELHQ